MPVLAEVRQMLKLAAREAKANRAANSTLTQQTLFILSSMSGQHKKARRYNQAMVCFLAYRVLKEAGSVKAAWHALQEDDVIDGEPIGHTPVSNTGVTEQAAVQVPIDYFTGGKDYV